MLTVQCENPKCRKMIPKHTAAVFHDDEYWEHYACDNPICTARAIFAIDLKLADEFRFKEAVENCR